MQNMHNFAVLMFSETTICKFSFSLTTSSKKRFLYRCFPVSFYKYLSIPFLQNTCFLFDFYFWFILTSEAAVRRCFQNSSCYKFFNIHQWHKRGRAGCDCTALEKKPAIFRGMWKLKEIICRYEWHLKFS